MGIEGKFGISSRHKIHAHFLAVSQAASFVLSVVFGPHARALSPTFSALRAYLLFFGVAGGLFLSPFVCCSTGCVRMPFLDKPTRSFRQSRFAPN